MKLQLLELSIGGYGSPPARGRGLKQKLKPAHTMCVFVAPRAGAGIETSSRERPECHSPCRPPRGGGD